MASESEQAEFSLPAAADYSATKFRLVAINGSAQIALCGAGARPDGVMSNHPKAGAMARFWMRGGAVRKLEYAGTIAAGASLMSDATGKVITAATTGSVIIGKALVAGVSGDVHGVFYDNNLGKVP